MKTKGKKGGSKDKICFNSKLVLFINFRYCNFFFFQFLRKFYSKCLHITIKTSFPELYTVLFFSLFFIFRLTQISRTCLMICDLMKSNVVMVQHSHFLADNTYQVDSNILCWEITRLFLSKGAYNLL